MQEITELEQRIGAALERIGKGVERLSGRSAATGSPSSTAGLVPSGVEAALRAQLEEEKALTAQLQDRLRIQKERETKGDLQAKIDRLTQLLDVKGLEVQRLRRSVGTLREQLAALRSDQAAKVAEPGHINKAMAAEIDALRAMRMAEISEMDEILVALEPHLTEAGNA
jgi:chromosome segregation ATPase